MGSVDKALHKFNAQVESQAFYEAQQQILSVYRRLRAKRLTHDSQGLLERAIHTLLDHEQAQLAAELAQTLLGDLTAQASEESGSEQAYKAAVMLGAFMSYFEQDTVSPEVYISVAKAAVKLIKACKMNDPVEDIAAIHTSAGRHIFTCRGLDGFSEASSYFARGTDFEEYEELIERLMDEIDNGKPPNELGPHITESDYVLFRSALKIIILNPAHLFDRLDLASELYSGIIAVYDREEHLLYKAFKSLLDAVAMKDERIFNLIRKEYKAVFDGDPGIDTDLDKISALYLRSSTARGGLNVLLDGLLGSLAS